MTVYCKGFPEFKHWGTATLLTPDITLTANDILVWFDVIYQEDLAEVIRLNGTPGLLVSTAHVEPLLDSCPVQQYPWFLLNTCKDMAMANVYDHLPVNHCFNFLINKKQINRYLLLKLIDWFGLRDYDYTWSGIGTPMDLSDILSEFDQLSADMIPDLAKFKTHVLSSIDHVPKKFFANDSVKITGSGMENYGSNVGTWNQFLGSMISQTAISLITESIRREHYMVYTEKTIYAVQGLTFPIWVGGYAQARTWANKGFDIFDDVINHDYQYCDTLLERCTRAVADNLQILTDLNFAREQKLANLPRLHRNRELLVPVFEQQNQLFWQAAPEQLLQARPKQDWPSTTLS